MWVAKEGRGLEKEREEHRVREEGRGQKDESPTMKVFSLQLWPRRGK